MQVVRWHHYDFFEIYTDHCNFLNKTENCVCTYDNEIIFKNSLHSLHADTVVSANSL